MSKEYEQAVCRRGNPKYRVCEEMLTIIHNQRNANFKTEDITFI